MVYLKHVRVVKHSPESVAKARPAAMPKPRSDAQLAKERAQLGKEIAAYETKYRAKLEADHCGKYVLVHNEELIGVYEDNYEAMQEAVAKFGRGPYLIREIGKELVGVVWRPNFVYRYKKPPCTSNAES